MLLQVTNKINWCEFSQKLRGCFQTAPHEVMVSFTGAATRKYHRLFIVEEDDFIFNCCTSSTVKHPLSSKSGPLCVAKLWNKTAASSFPIFRRLPVTNLIAMLVILHHVALPMITAAHSTTAIPSVFDQIRGMYQALSGFCQLQRN